MCCFLEKKDNFIIHIFFSLTDKVTCVFSFYANRQILVSLQDSSWHENCFSDFSLKMH